MGIGDWGLGIGKIVLSNFLLYIKFKYKKELL